MVSDAPCPAKRHQCIFPSLLPLLLIIYICLIFFCNVFPSILLFVYNMKCCWCCSQVGDKLHNIWWWWSLLLVPLANLFPRFHCCVVCVSVLSCRRLNLLFVLISCLFPLLQTAVAAMPCLYNRESTTTRLFARRPSI